MAFRNIIKDIIESKVMNEEEFDSKDSKLFSDFLSNKKAAEIIDGLLKKSKNNPTKALEALEKMSKHTGDGFQNREEVEKAKVGLKALANKKKLSQKDISKLRKFFGKEWDLIWSLGTKNQRNVGLALGGVPGMLAATALGGVANAAANAAANWATKKYVNRGLGKESSDDYEKLQRRIVEAIGKEVVYKTEDAISILINNDINPGFYKTMGSKTVAVFFEGTRSEPYELTAVVDLDVMNSKKMLVTRKAQLKFTKIFGDKAASNSAKYLSIDEFKSFIKKVRETDSNPRTKKSIEFLDRYFSKNEIAQKKLNDIEVLREKLFDYGIQISKDEIIKKDQTNLSAEEKAKILDASIVLERKYYPVEKEFGLDYLFGATNIDRGLIEQFVTPFIDKKGNIAFNWPTRIKETVKEVYNDHKNEKTLNDLLETLGINVKEAPSDETYYWQQLIRTTYDNPTPFYSKRFMPYDKEETDPIAIFDDEKLTNRFNSNYKVAENPLLPYVVFYTFYQTDLVELSDIKRNKSELFKKFLKEDLNIEENSPKNQEIVKNINISDSLFLQYKVLYFDQYKNNTHKQLGLTDAIVSTNFVYFKNNAAFDIEYKQIKSECEKVKNKISFDKSNSSFLIDMSDTIFNPNGESLQKVRLKLKKEDIKNIQRNIKSAQDIYQEVNVEKTIDNVTVPGIIVKIFDSLVYAQNHDENEAHKFMYPHLFLTFLYAYSQNKENLDFISSYDQLSKKMAEKGQKDPIFDGIMGLLQQAGTVDVHKSLKENIEDYWNKIGNTIDYQDGEYRLINIGSIGYLHPGESNTSPLYIFECVSNKKDYDQSLSVNLEGLHDLMDNKALKRNTYRVYENPLPSIMNKQLNAEKYRKSNQPEEITMARELYLILDRLNKIFDPERPELWTGFLGAFGAQVGETIEDIFRIKSIFVMPSRIRLVYEVSQDHLRFLSPAAEGTEEHELNDQELKEIAPQAFMLKMSPYSDLIGINVDGENRKDIKTPTTRILLEDFIHVLTIKDPKQQMEEYNSRANAFSVLTSIGEDNANSLHRKLIWLEKQGFFCTKKEIANKIQSADLRLIRSQLSDEVIEQFKNMKIAMDETDKKLSVEDFKKKEYMSWFPDTEEMSNIRGIATGKTKFYHKGSEVNKKFGILRK